MIKLHLDVSDVIHVNKHTKYANCGLPVNFWGFFVDVVLFYDEKGSLLAKVVTLASVPF